MIASGEKQTPSCWMFVTASLGVGALLAAPWAGQAAPLRYREQRTAIPEKLTRKIDGIDHFEGGHPRRRADAMPAIGKKYPAKRRGPQRRWSALLATCWLPGATPEKFRFAKIADATIQTSAPAGKKGDMQMDYSAVQDVDEGDVIIALYEAKNGTHDSYSLMRAVRPEVELGTQKATEAFEKTRGATERLIARSLVGGERLSGADGVWFRKLKLTPKGERAAIDFRDARKSK